MVLQRVFSAKIVVFACFVVILTGCWDRQEIEDRAIVLGIAVDEVEEESKEESSATHLKKGNFAKGKMLQITAQIAIPGRIPLGSGGGSSEGGGGQPGKAVWVLQVKGHTIDDVLASLQQQLSGRLFYGHLRVVIVSEDFAKNGLDNLNDFLHREPQIRRSAWIAVTPGKASKLMFANPQLQIVPSLYLLDTLDHAVRRGKFPLNIAGAFWSAVSAKGQEGFLPYLELKEADNIELAGLAYFKGSKMVGRTEPLQIGYFMAIKGLNPAGYRALYKVPGEPTLVMLSSYHRNSKISGRIRQGKPYFDVVIHLEMNFMEKSNNQLIVQTNELQKIEKEFAREAEAQIEQFVKETQQKGSDIFGFGERVRAKLPSYWNENIQTTENWQEMYRDIEIDVKVKVKIRRIGTKAR